MRKRNQNFVNVFKEEDHSGPRESGERLKFVLMKEKLYFNSNPMKWGMQFVISFLIVFIALLSSAKADVDYASLEQDFMNSLKILYQEAPLLPRVNVSLISCGYANAYYDPMNNEIVVCKELIDITYQVDEDNFGISSGDIIARNAMNFFFLHELGHYLIDQCNLPVLGKEEDAADSFAVYMSLKMDKPDIALDGAITFMTLTQYGLESTPYWDEHSFNLQRAYSILCWIYGSNPEQYSFIVQAAPELQTRNCSLEYERTIEGWDNLLQKCKKKYSLDLNSVNPFSVSLIYISLLGRSPDGEGLFYWLRTANLQHLTLDELARSIYFAAINYPEYSYLKDPFSLIKAVYKNVLNKTYEDDPDGIIYWTDQVELGKIAPGDVALVIARTALQQYPDHPATLALINRAIGGFKIASVLLRFIGDFDIYRDLNQSINDDPESVDYAVEQAEYYKNRFSNDSPVSVIEDFKRLNSKLNSHRVLIVLSNGKETSCLWKSNPSDPLKFKVVSCEDPSFNDIDWESVFLSGNSVVISDGHTQQTLTDVDPTQGCLSFEGEWNGEKYSGIVGFLK